MAGTAVSRKARIDSDDIQSNDIQGLVLQGYGRLRAAAFLVLAITDGEHARGWLRRILPDVTLGDRRPKGRALNLAFTAGGLTRLGLPDEVMAGFSPEFLEGMTSPHRSRLLGDAGAAAPEHWAWGGPDGPEVDALLLVYAQDEAGLSAYLAELRAGLATAGLAELATLDTRDIGFGEHFGFRDGLSQPTIIGSGRQGPAMHELKPGELLLGYLNEHGQYPRSPLVPADQDPENLLPRRTAGAAGTSAPVEPRLSDAHDLGSNGSYLVVRTLSQDVGAFWHYADQATRGSDGAPDPEARTHLAARLVGRWPSGAPLTRSPDRDRPEIAEDNDFGFHAADEQGHDCPLGAHIRRTNPRDSLPPDPGTQGSIDVGKRHRLLRRGRPYGPPVDVEEALAAGPDATDRRGLHFLALCADIARQFEFMSHTWVHNPNFSGLLDDADPLLGGHTGRGDSFTVQTAPVRRRLVGLPAFVTVRGGAYLFLPSARALHYLAEA